MFAEEGLAMSNVTGGSSLRPEPSVMKVAEVMAARRMTDGKPCPPATAHWRIL